MLAWSYLEDFWRWQDAATRQDLRALARCPASDTAEAVAGHFFKVRFQIIIVIILIEIVIVIVIKIVTI